MLKNLFKKLNSTNATKTKNEPEKIICPYCFKKFSHEQVHFRMPGNLKLEDITKLGVEFVDGRKYELGEDQRLNEWYDKFNLGEAPDQYPAVRASSISEGKRIYADNSVLTEIIVDENGNRSSKRLCPECHNDLPLTAGKSPILIVSVIGTTASGKSVYLTTLIDQLLRHTAPNMGASVLPINNDQIKRLYGDQYFKRLLKDGEMLEASMIKKEIPLIYHLNFRKDPIKQSVTICFFDVAGEAVTNGELLELEASNIRNSDALMFLVDPTNLWSIKEKLTITSGEELNTKVVQDEPTDVITALYNDFIHREGGSSTSKPTAVVLTKSDLLHAMANENGEYIKKNSNMFQNATHKGFFNLTAFENINGEVKQFVSKVDPLLSNLIGDYFDNIGFFAVSALGSKPVKDQNDNSGRTVYKVDGELNPFRVDEPLLWILNQKGFIDNGRNEE